MSFADIYKSYVDSCINFDEFFRPLAYSAFHEYDIRQDYQSVQMAGSRMGLVVGAGFFSVFGIF